MSDHTEMHHMTHAATEQLAERHGLIDLVAAEADAHTDDVAELLLGFLVSLPDPTRVREPAVV